MLSQVATKWLKIAVVYFLGLSGLLLCAGSLYANGAIFQCAQEVQDFEHFDVVLFRRSQNASMPPAILRSYKEYSEGKLSPFRADSPGFPASLPLKCADFSLLPQAWPESSRSDLRAMEKFFRVEYPDDTYTLAVGEKLPLRVTLVNDDHDHPRKMILIYETDGKQIQFPTLIKPNVFDLMPLWAMFMAGYTVVWILFFLAKNRLA